MPEESQAKSQTNTDAPRQMDPHAQTWLSLLAHWTEFAQAAKALPNHGENTRWKSTAPAIITLQAVTFALADLANLNPDERPLAIDRAQILISANTATIRQAWKDEPLPQGLTDLINDATVALQAARKPATNPSPMKPSSPPSALEWSVATERLIAEHPATLVDALLASGFDGDLYVPTPGVPLFERCPAVFAKGSNNTPLDDTACALIEDFFEGLANPTPAPTMRQPYRQFDFGKGRAVRDLVVPANTQPPGGQPLLMPALLNGQPLPVPLPIRGASAQPALPVVFLNDHSESTATERER